MNETGGTEDREDLLDDGPERAGQARHVPMRRCIVKGSSFPRDSLIRFVIGPDDVPVPDLKAELPGRGMWLSADPGSIKTASARNLFARAARRKVTVPDDLVERVEALLVRRLVEMLSLARRAGEAVTGFEKVHACLKSGHAAVLVEALDGAEDGRRKLAAVAGNTPIVALLRADEIGAAFGRDRAVHAAMTPGGLAERFVNESRRLSAFRDRDAQG